MKQITNKEYEEWLKYKEEKAKGHMAYTLDAGGNSPETVSAWDIGSGRLSNTGRFIVGSSVFCYASEPYTSLLMLSPPLFVRVI